MPAVSERKDRGSQVRVVGFGATTPTYVPGDVRIVGNVENFPSNSMGKFRNGNLVPPF